MDKKILSKSQSEIVRSAGLKEDDWRFLFEDELYLHVIEAKTPAKIKIIDKKSRTVCY